MSLTALVIAFWAGSAVALLKLAVKPDSLSWDSPVPDAPQLVAVPPTTHSKETLFWYP